MILHRYECDKTCVLGCHFYLTFFSNDIVVQVGKVMPSFDFAIHRLALVRPCLGLSPLRADFHSFHISQYSLTIILVSFSSSCLHLVFPCTEYHVLATHLLHGIPVPYTLYMFLGNVCLVGFCVLLAMYFKSEFMFVFFRFGLYCLIFIFVFFSRPLINKSLPITIVLYC